MENHMSVNHMSEYSLGFFLQNFRKGSLVKTGKSKPGGKKGKFDVGGGLTSGKKSKRKDEDEDEEILSDASDVVGKEGGPPDAGYSRLVLDYFQGSEVNFGW